MRKLPRLLRFAFWPRFLHYPTQDDPYARFSSYTRIWGVILALLLAVALVPLMILAAIDYKLTEDSILQDATARLDRVTSNSRRSVTFFLDERAAALRFLVQEHSLETLSDADTLRELLDNLKVGFGGLVDLGVIDAQGRQVAYAGPYQLQGKEYGDQPWFQRMTESGVYISDVFRGLRDVPHMFLAVRAEPPGQRPYILRATLDTQRLANLLAPLQEAGEGDAFLVNRRGVVQTPSLSHGRVLAPSHVPVPDYTEHTDIFRTTDPRGEEHLVGYAYIENSPFVLLVTRPLKHLMAAWAKLRVDMIGFLLVSVLGIVAVITIISTYMINKVFEADRRQAKTLEQMEDTNRLASIGRLAAGVAHEVNNPLAIIDMKAGLIRDMLLMSGKECADARMLSHIDSVIQSVDRCGRITKQLLGFARQVELNIQEMDLADVVEDVLSFMEKEAHYRGINVELAVDDELPKISSDRGKLQQILLNLVTNAFQAMGQGGRLAITATLLDADRVQLVVADDGPGIEPENMKKIFEPFFTTKRASGGSGLGLAISYGLVKKLDGTIEVESEPGKGTVFTLTLPVAMPEWGEHDTDTAG